MALMLKKVVYAFDFRGTLHDMYKKQYNCMPLWT